ncbi:MAG: reductive dehalogenase [Candidatus Aminicenantes bacterium]|nr:MAG: reductive dehalogenase [Candidatus Aminicenantes bacterium]
MNWLRLMIIGGVMALLGAVLFFILMSFYSLLEKERRAAERSALLALGLGGGLVLLFSLHQPSFLMIGASLGWLIILFCLGLVLSPRPRTQLRIVASPARIDERDVIFARFDLEINSDHYRQYYELRPHLKSLDDSLRQLPDLLDRCHWQKFPWEFALAEAEFDFIETFLSEVGGPPEGEKFSFSPEEATVMVKRLAHYLGAQLCGVCELDPAFVYSHVGRGPEPYGQKIELNHRYAIVFAVEMSLAMVATAPQAPVVVETAVRYTEAAHISIILAKTIQKLGYPARAHIAGSNYQVILPPLAWKAGLGELGRLGIIVTYPYGPRVRLGVVTTDLPLVPDQPISFGVQDFCASCLKCARCCPAQAIPHGERQVDNGITRWVIDREACYRFWRQVGTDCATCLYVCPYSKENNLFHQVIRVATRSSRLAQKVAVKSDDFFYGRRPPAKPNPLGKTHSAGFKKLTLRKKRIL